MSFLFGHTAHLGSYFPDQRSNPCPLQWKHGSLIVEPPRESPEVFSECQTPQVCGCVNLSSHWSDRAWFQQDVPALSL